MVFEMDYSTNQAKAGTHKHIHKSDHSANQAQAAGWHSSPSPAKPSMYDPGRFGEDVQMHMQVRPACPYHTHTHTHTYTHAHTVLVAIQCVRPTVRARQCSLRQYIFDSLSRENDPLWQIVKNWYRRWFYCQRGCTCRPVM